MNKILLTADNSVLTDLYRDKFHEQGFDIILAGDGSDLIWKLENNRPDIILIDPLMPGIKGVETINFIRSHERLRNLPVILLSDLSHTCGIVQAAWQAGASSFLSKSDATPATVLREVRRLLEAAEDVVQEQIFKDRSGSRPVKVLLADDDRTIHSILEFHLTQAGIEMSSTFNGKEALAKAELGPLCDDN